MKKEVVPEVAKGKISGTTVANIDRDIIRNNNLSADGKIYPGQKLEIPNVTVDKK